MELDVPKYGFYEGIEPLEFDSSSTDSDYSHSIDLPLKNLHSNPHNLQFNVTPASEQDTPKPRHQPQKIRSKISMEETAEFQKIRLFNQNANAIQSIYTNLLQLIKQKRIPITTALLDTIQHRAHTDDQIAKQEYALRKWLTKMDSRTKQPILRVLLQQSQLTPSWIQILQSQQITVEKGVK